MIFDFRGLTFRPLSPCGLAVRDPTTGIWYDTDNMCRHSLESSSGEVPDLALYEGGNTRCIVKTIQFPLPCDFEGRIDNAPVVKQVDAPA